jgi:hypothetical protein
MASGLNSRNPLVNILDDEHFKAKKLRFEFVRYIFVSGLINGFLCTIAFILMNSYIRAGVHFFVTMAVTFGLIRDTVRRINLKNVSGIIFDNAEYTSYANNEIVFDAMRHICEMKGMIEGRRSIVNLLHILSLLSIIVELIGGLL